MAYKLTRETERDVTGMGLVPAAALEIEELVEEKSTTGPQECTQIHLSRFICLAKYRCLILGFIRLKTYWRNDWNWHRQFFCQKL